MHSIPSNAKNKWFYLSMGFPVAADIVDHFIFDTINDRLIEVLNTPALSSLLLIIGLYFAFIIATFLTGSLKTGVDLTPEGEKSVIIRHNEKNKISAPNMLFLYPSLSFGIILFLLIMNTTGITSDKPAFTDTEIQTAIWSAIIMFFLHIFVCIKPMKPRFSINKPGYFFTLSAIVIICVFIINLSLAAWIYLLSDPLKEVDPNRASRYLEMIGAFLFFIVFFASPRFMFMSRRFDWLSFSSAVVLIGHFAWSSLAYIEF